MTIQEKAAGYDEIVQECREFKHQQRGVTSGILVTRLMSVLVGRVLNIVGLGRKSYQPEWPSND